MGTALPILCGNAFMITASAAVYTTQQGRFCFVENPSPQPPPRNGEGEKKRRRLACSPSPFGGGVLAARRLLESHFRRCVTAQPHCGLAARRRAGDARRSRAAAPSRRHPRWSAPFQV